MSEKLIVSQVMRRYLLESIHDNTKMMLGKVLTIVDAISENETRRKAIHDLVQQTIWGEVSHLREGVFYTCDCLSKKLGEVQSEKEESSLVKCKNIFDR